MRKRILCLFMALALCLTLVPVPTSATFANVAEEAELCGATLDATDLLMRYLEREAGVLSEASLLAEAGDRLTGLEAAIYRELKAAFQEIAAGRRQSTQITLDLDALGYPQTKSFSNESFVRIANALFADCPYDLYWFGSRYASSTMTMGGNILSLTLKFSVSQSYAAGEYQVRGDLGYLLSTVQTNAGNIVKKYAGKGDYEKLKAYKDEICAWVDYDYDAASYGSSQTDSNPYQLISVFDGDESTKVVCEGYAKAFQFLCDLSTFRASDCVCYHVKGMTGGRHSWNHVTLGGSTYLVDVTNCDEGSVGYPDGLFMKHAVAGANTRATGYKIPISDDNFKTYTDIDFYQYSRSNNRANENFYDQDAPFLTLATTPYDPSASGTPSAPTYKVTIVSGTGSGDYKEGDTVTISANAAPTGCEIWGWRGPSSSVPLTFVKGSPVKQASFTMPDYDVTFRALYSYIVTLDPNEGTLEQSSQELKFTTDKTYVEAYDLPTPTRAGHTFQGWYTKKEGGVEVKGGAMPSTLASHTLYAHWQKQKATYTLSCSPASVNISEGESVTVTLSYTNNDFKYFCHDVDDNSVISVQWGTQNGYTKSLTITGLSAGQETVTFSLLDEDENELVSQTLSVTVSPKSSPLPTITPQIAAGNASASPGTAVEIPVTIRNNPGISGAALSVSYDKSAFTLKDIKRGSVFGTGTYTAYPESGVVSWYSTENVTTDGTLFTLQFTVRGNAGAGTYPVTIGVREGKAANLTNADSQTVSAEFVAGALEVTPGLRGDVTGDNDVAMNDVVKVARAVAKKITLTDAEKALADVTGDGLVAINDVVKLARYVAGNIASLQADSPAGGASAVIETATVSGNPGETVRVPVRITENPGIAGAQLGILFDAGLTLTDIIRGEVMSVGTFEPDIAAAGVQWYYDQASVTDTGILFTLEFEIGADATPGTAYAVTVNVSDGITANLSDYDSNPVGATFQPGKIQVGKSAASTAVNAVSRDGSTVTAEIVCADSGATVFCVAYSNSGQMLAMCSAPVTGESAYPFEFDGQKFDYAKVLLLDGNSVPLCDPRTT